MRRSRKDPLGGAPRARAARARATDPRAADGEGFGRPCSPRRRRPRRNSRKSSSVARRLCYHSSAALSLTRPMLSNGQRQSMTPEQLRGLIRDVPDFPKPGIVFKDITPLLEHPEGFRSTIERLAEGVEGLGARRILAIESDRKSVV